MTDNEAVKNSLTFKQAAEYLGVSSHTLWQYLKRIEIPYTIHPLDHRVKLFRKKDIDNLKAQLATKSKAE